MSKRKIIKINAKKCNGCGLCIPNCPEGAIQIIDGKARLISDLFCDGLGACIGHCPQGAITIEEREAKGYDERRVMANIVKQGKNVIKAHLEHLREHKQDVYLRQALDFLKENNIEIPDNPDNAALHQHAVGHSGCPGSKLMDFRNRRKSEHSSDKIPSQSSELRQWPIQIMLVPAFAPYLKGADLLVAADCVPFAYADFHKELLKEKILLVGCPKLDDVSVYKEKFSEILRNNNIKSLTYAHMEVPCCSGLTGVLKNAIAESGKDVPFKEVVISISGEKL